MSNQVKIPSDVKREVAIFSAATGRTQSELLAASWHEFRERHATELEEGLKWARDILANPTRAAVEASGMSREDLDEIERASRG